MDDFASPNITSAYDVPPAKNNFISPGKRPMSSMSTTVVTDQQGRVVAVAGASGGTKIITAVAQVWQWKYFLIPRNIFVTNKIFSQALLRMLYLGQNVKEAVDARRLHHQLFPMNLNYEDGITTVGDNIIMLIIIYEHNIRSGCGTP